MKTHICTYCNSNNFSGNIDLLRNNYLSVNSNGFFNYNFDNICLGTISLCEVS